MKLCAALLVFCAAVCAGFAIRERLQQRVDICTALNLFLCELRFFGRLHKPLPDVLTALSLRPELSALPFLADCVRRLQKGDSLPSAWADAVERYCRRERVFRQARTFADLIPALCAADAERYDALLSLYEARAQQMLESAQKTAASAARQCVYISGAIGLACGILIL